MSRCYPSTESQNWQTVFYGIPKALTSIPKIQSAIVLIENIRSQRRAVLNANNSHLLSVESIARVARCEDPQLESRITSFDWRIECRAKRRAVTFPRRIETKTREMVWRTEFARVLESRVVVSETCASWHSTRRTTWDPTTTIHLATAMSPGESIKRSRPTVTSQRRPLDAHVGIWRAI